MRVQSYIFFFKLWCGLTWGELLTEGGGYLWNSRVVDKCGLVFSPTGVTVRLS